MACRQPWYEDSESPCPYGTAAHGFDVTMPTDPTFGEGLCVFYSFLPYPVILCGAAWLAARRTLGSAAFLGLAGVVAALGKLWKAVAASPRPLGTCLPVKIPQMTFLD